MADRLRDAALRLAAELDEARLYQAAAYASMVADAVDQSRGQPVSARAAATDVELEFELDEHGRAAKSRSPNGSDGGRNSDGLKHTPPNRS
ncbi:MAG: hypothetical protein JOZ90_10590 [Alphaproteobacteria bacterium]|nr:hypothetical protein [Alphaproteobacteria bacterium]MBV9371094.1 hypothetical protein [Alphaproteobacteria bacterium]MBV9901532.1 hypothetical protein [Alphaproteobacteria bacterium]